MGEKQIGEATRSPVSRAQDHLDECPQCAGAPCEIQAECRVCGGYPRGPITMKTVRRLEDCGSFALADIARKYAVDRPRWWNRVKRGTA